MRKSRQPLPLRRNNSETTAGSLVRRWVKWIWRFPWTARQLGFRQQVLIVCGAYVIGSLALASILVLAEMIGGPGTAMKAVAAAMKPLQAFEIPRVSVAAPSAWSRILQLVALIFVVLPVGLVMLIPLATFIGELLDGVSTFPEVLREEKRAYQHARLREQLSGKPKRSAASIGQFVLACALVVISQVTILRPHTLSGWLGLPLVVLGFLAYLWWLRKK